LWSGYPSYGENDGKGNCYLFLFFLYMGSEEDANKAIAVFDTMLSENTKTIARSYEEKKNHKTWLDWHGP